jgi:tetratricopeptide (TPR) repeat protein
VASTLHDLANLYSVQELNRKAEPLVRHALTLIETHHGSDHPALVEHLELLSWIEEEYGRNDAKVAALERAIAILEKAYGLDHPGLANLLNNLGAHCMQTAGKQHQATPLFERAIAITEKAHGPQASDIAIYATNLAFLYQITGRRDEAKALKARAAAIKAARKP